MSRNKKNKLYKLIAFILIIVGVGAGIWYGFRSLRKGSYMDNILEIGGNSNIELLKQLNENWMLPDEYSLEIKEVNGITMEWVQKKGTNPDKAILQLHGGAYTRSLEDNGITYQRAAVQYAKLSGAGVLTVDYRVAPEHPYPAALEDAVQAYKWLLGEGYPPENIIIAGDSAGGGLVLATSLYIRDNDMPMPAALITMSAWTNLNYRRRTPAYVGNNPANNPYISPAFGEYSGFPPVLMQVGGDEILLNDTIKVAQKAKEAGVVVQQTTYPGMFHVFQMLFPELSDANMAWDEVESFIKDIFAEKQEVK